MKPFMKNEQKALSRKKFTLDNAISFAEKQAEDSTGNTAAIYRQMAKEKKWEQCTGGAIAWLGLDVDMDIREIADWLEALALSGGCGFGSGDAFGDSSNSLATWVSSLAEKIRKTDSSRPLRNCDVGTAKEQWSRFEKMCFSNRQTDDPDYCSCKCKVDGGCVNDCALIWAQMPYEPSKSKDE